MVPPSIESVHPRFSPAIWYVTFPQLSADPIGPAFGPSWEAAWLIRLQWPMECNGNHMFFQRNRIISMRFWIGRFYLPGAIFFLEARQAACFSLCWHLQVGPSSWGTTSTKSTTNSRDLRTCVPSSDNGGNAFLLIFKQILERWNQMSFLPRPEITRSMAMVYIIFHGWSWLFRHPHPHTSSKNLSDPLDPQRIFSHRRATPGINAAMPALPGRLAVLVGEDSTWSFKPLISVASCHLRPQFS